MKKEEEKEEVQYTSWAQQLDVIRKFHLYQIIQLKFLRLDSNSPLKNFGGKEKFSSIRTLVLNARICWLQCCGSGSVESVSFTWIQIRIRIVFAWIQIRVKVWSGSGVEGCSGDYFVILHCSRKSEKHEQIRVVSRTISCSISESPLHFISFLTVYTVIKDKMLLYRTLLTFQVNFSCAFYISLRLVKFEFCVEFVS